MKKIKLAKGDLRDLLPLHKSIRKFLKILRSIPVELHGPYHQLSTTNQQLDSGTINNKTNQESPSL